MVASALSILTINNWQAEGSCLVCFKFKNKLRATNLWLLIICANLNNVIPQITATTTENMLIEKSKLENLEDTTTDLTFDDYVWTEYPFRVEAPNQNDSRVNGGEIVKKIVPYQVSMQLQRRGKWRHFCSGSVITSNHVLTAAHCVDGRKPSEISIVVGTLTWKKGGDRHRAVAIRTHPNYAMNTRIINDIAVVKVTPAFNLKKSNVGTISLGGPTRVGDRVAVRLTGWGSTTPLASNGLPEQLQMLNYRTISNEECQRLGFKVTKNELCALAKRGQGACVGDSGGPLVTSPNFAPTLVGIVSYGTASCAQGSPDVYARVSSFLAYINRVITQEIP